MAESTFWPLAQQLTYTWLTSRVLGVTGYTETDDQSAVPRFVVELAGGGSDGFEREADVEVTAVTSDLPSLRALTTRLTSAMWALAGEGNVHGFVDEVRERFAFADDPFPDGGLRRARAVFSLVLRPLA